jgi:signal transduction histidine kinase
MPPDIDENTRQSRGLTDHNLDAERAKVDDELAARADALQEDADEVIRRARERAEVVLHVARARRDAASMADTPRQREWVAEERAQEDRVRMAEEAASDATLAAERELRRQALVELLAYERRGTDAALLDERTRSDEALQHRDDMFAVVNHDFLNLISSVALNAATIVRQADERDERGQRIIGRADAISRATLRMQEVVSSLLDVVSISAGMLHVERRAADAADVAREVVLLFEPVAAAKGLSLEAHLGTEPLHAVFDPPRLTQVLTNLLANAIKFTSPPGAVSLRVSRIGSELEFIVSDAGCGIPADQLTTIFDRFTRARGTRASGHGLGLYICRELVAAHDGQLTVESEEGRGSTFKFRIAAADAYAAQSDVTQ